MADDAYGREAGKNDRIEELANKITAQRNEMVGRLNDLDKQASYAQKQARNQNQGSIARDVALVIMLIGAVCAGFSYMVNDSSAGEALLVRVVELELEPPQDHNAAQRRAITHDQDLRLCQRACDVMAHARETHEYIEREYISAVCEWLPDGIRNCDCECSLGEAPLDIHTYDEHDRPLTVLHETRWRPIIAQVRESR